MKRYLFLILILLFGLSSFAHAQPMMVGTDLTAMPGPIAILPTFGAEKATDGNFAAGTCASWTFNVADWTCGASNIAKDANGTNTLSQNMTEAAGQYVKITFDITGFSAGTFTVAYGASYAQTCNSANGATQSITQYHTAQGTTNFTITPSNDARFTLDNISAKVMTNGGLTLYNPLFVPFGSVGYPSFSLIGDTDSGFFWDANRKFNLVIDGASIFNVASTGTVNIATTNADGIIFGSLGTATKGIDLSSSELSGVTDYPIYLGVSDYWTASGLLSLSTNLVLPQGDACIYTAAAGRGIRIWGGAINDFTSGASIYLYGSTTTRGGNLILAGATAKGSILFTDKDPMVASLTSVTVSGSDLLHADIDTSTAVGEVVHIISGTGVTVGFYRITVVGVNQVTVDHAPGGAGTNIALTIYKDVIGIFATDGTNGQRIMNYSAQNKPLQIGGDVLTATSGLTAKDIFFGGEIGSGGTTNTTTTNTYVVGGGQAASTKNTGWLQVYIGTTLSWIPYWSNATP